MSTRHGPTFTDFDGDNLAISAASRTSARREKKTFKLEVRNRRLRSA